MMFRSQPTAWYRVSFTQLNICMTWPGNPWSCLVLVRNDQKQQVAFGRREIQSANAYIGKTSSFFETPCIIYSVYAIFDFSLAMFLTEFSRKWQNAFCRRKSKNWLLSDNRYCYSPVLNFLSCILFALKSFAFDNKSHDYIIIKSADVKMSIIWIYSQIHTLYHYHLHVWHLKRQIIEMYKIQTQTTATAINIWYLFQLHLW